MACAVLVRVRTTYEGILSIKSRTMIGLAKGIVLDVGPGSGEWIGLFDKRRVIKVRVWRQLKGVNLILIRTRYRVWVQIQIITTDYEGRPNWKT
jgi:hypothetical protein